MSAPRGLFLVALTFAPGACSPSGGPPEPIRAGVECTVTRVVDGDSLECDPLGRVRLIGIDAPEIAQAPFGALAGAALVGLIPVGSRVTVEPDVVARDQYERALGYLWSDGALINWRMLRNGFALLATYQPNVQYVVWLEAAEREARREGLGLWESHGFACPPRDYRRGLCR